MAVPVFTVGQVLTAALTNSWLAPLAAYKPSDQSRTSTTTLGNDNDLVLAVAASSTYLMVAYINYEAASGTGDLKTGWTVPAGTTMAYGHIGQTTAGTISTASVTTTSDQTNNPNYGGNGAGTATAAYLFGTVLTSSTAGNLQFQWAQATSSGTATKVKAGSVLVLRRVA